MGFVWDLCGIGMELVWDLSDIIVGVARHLCESSCDIYVGFVQHFLVILAWDLMISGMALHNMVWCASRWRF